MAAPAGITEGALVAELGAVTPAHAGQVAAALAAQGLVHVRAAPPPPRAGPPRLLGGRARAPAAPVQARSHLNSNPDPNPLLMRWLRAPGRVRPPRLLAGAGTGRRAEPAGPAAADLLTTARLVRGGFLS